MINAGHSLLMLTSPKLQPVQPDFPSYASDGYRRCRVWAVLDDF